MNNTSICRPGRRVNWILKGSFALKVGNCINCDFFKSGNYELKQI